VFVGSDQFADWLFAQRRGVPPTTPPLPQISFTPPGGAQAGPVSVSISTTVKDPGLQLRYTLDGLLPTATTGTRYAAPFMISSSGILQGALFWPNDDGNQIVYHAAPFMIGSMALPDGGASAPVDGGRVADGGVAPADARLADATANGGRGGGGAGGSAVPPPGGAGGAPMPPAGSSGSASSGVAGGATGGAGGESSSPAGMPVGGMKRGASGGCSYTADGRGASPLGLVVGPSFLVALRRRRRR
jgi:hypothetical protein